MDSYVIRIYRRDEKNPEHIAGQVEFVEQEETRLFADTGELIRILLSKSRQRKQGKGPRSGTEK